MRAWVCVWILCVGVAWAGVAVAAPRRDASPQYKRAIQLHDSGAYDQALASIAEGLAIAPKDLPLLGLEGTLLLELRDYSGARAAYQAYLAAGARGANRREAQKIVANLRAVESTFLEIQTENGPARIYLDSTIRGEFCTAAPSCNKPILPGDYKVIAERAGFERWTGQVSVENARTTKVVIRLVESSSLLTVRVAQPGARVTIDGATHEAPAKVPPGKHQVAVALAGYVEARLEATAHEGAPIDLDVALTQLVPIRIEPRAVALVFDGKPVAVANGRIAVPPGSHVLVAQAQGFRERRVEIPAERATDYRLDVELARVEVVAKPATSPVSSTRKIIGRRMIDLGLGAVPAAFAIGVGAPDARFNGWSIAPALAVAGGATAVAGIILYAIEPSERPPQAVRMVPTLGDHIGLAVAGRF